MDTLFTWLTEAMEGAPWLAVLGAAGWGAASLLLSPCHLASIPLIVGFISGRGTTTPRQALIYALLFTAGILSSIAVIGGATAAAGRMLGDMGAWSSYAVAVVLLVIGLYLLGLLPLPWERGLTLPRYQGKAAAIVLGLLFGLALGPCTFAYLAPILGAIFKVSHTNPIFAMLLLAAYGVGHGVLIVVAAVSTEKTQRVLDWNGRSWGALWLRRSCGALVVLGAIWLAFSARR